MFGCSDFEGASTRQDAFVLDGVADCAEAVTNGVSGLSNRVIVGTLDQDRAREGIFNAFDEGVFIFTKSLLVDYFGETKIGFSDIVD